MAKRKSDVLWEHLAKVPKLDPVPADILRLCSDFTAVPPFGNRTVSQFALNLNYPLMSVAVHDNGDLYISCLDDIQVVSREGQLIRTWQLEGDWISTHHAYPNSLCLVGDRLFVANRLDDHVHVYTIDGQLMVKWDIEGKIDALVVHQGEVFVTDISNNRINVYREDGTLVCTWGKGGNQPGELCRPSGVLISSRNEVWVTDWGNHRIQIFALDGTLLRIVNHHLPIPWQIVERGDEVLVGTGVTLVSFKLDGSHSQLFAHKHKIQGLAVNRQDEVIVTSGNQVHALE